MSNQIVIDSNKRKLSLNIKELIAYKDLLFTLAYRDLRVRYAQTTLGFLWGIIQPIFTLLIFILVFGKVAKVNTGNVPYPLFALCGMSAWTYFAFVTSQASSSIIGAQNMISKIYFPRLIIPISKSLVGLIDFSITFVFLIIMMAYFQFSPTGNVIFFPIFLALALLSGLTIGIWLSALMVRFRDFQHIVPFMVQLGLYITPIAYPSSLIPEKYKVIYFMNPMAGVVEGFRWSLLGTDSPNSLIFLSSSIIVILFISGLFYFRSVERIMADIV